jgi:hypothetical protein
MDQAIADVPMPDAAEELADGMMQEEEGATEAEDAGETQTR